MILVMGATGQVGSKIVTHLLANDQPVRCLARKYQNRESFAKAELITGDMNDVSTLMEAMRGCSAVFTMIPSDPTAKEVRFYQNKIGEVIAEAIEEARIKKVVNLSSVGADLDVGTGPITGLHDQEERLNEITHADIMHLRPTYFMENTLAAIPSIRTMNRYFGSVPEDIPLHMVATRDIAARAAFLLMNPVFKSHNIEYLLGERELSFKEVVKALGQAIRQPDLEYVEVADSEMRNYMLGAGLTEDWADSYIELNQALRNGILNSTVNRNKLNTTATSIEEFARTTFLEAYNQALDAAGTQAPPRKPEADAHP